MDRKEYVKFKPGATVNGTVSSKWHRYKKHWDNGKPTKCEGNACKLCKAGNFAKKAYRTDMVVDTVEGQKEMILDCGKMIYEQVFELQLDGDTVKDVYVSIRRDGQGLDTQYIVQREINPVEPKPGDIVDDIPF